MTVFALRDIFVGKYGTGKGDNKVCGWVVASARG